MEVKLLLDGKRNINNTLGYFKITNYLEDNEKTHIIKKSGWTKMSSLNMEVHGPILYNKNSRGRNLYINIKDINNPNELYNFLTSIGFVLKDTKLKHEYQK